MAAGGKGCEGCLENRRKLLFCGLCSLITFSVLAILVAVRHAWRSKQLEPLLDLVATSSVCLNAAAGVCELNVSQAAADEFDLHEHESPLLGFLYSQVARGEREEMRQVLCGAHIKLQDADGSVYDFLRKLPGAYRRISSHRSSRAQYGIPEGRVLSALLVGTLDNSTWLQLEGSPWDMHRLWASMGHVLDFIEYRVIRQNVGPLGTSKATDRRPLLAGPPAPTSEACPKPCPASPPPQPLQSLTSLVAVSATALGVGSRFRGSVIDGGGGFEDSLVKLGGGIGGASFAAAGGIRVGARFSRRLAPG